MKNVDQILNYLYGDLSKKEKIAFEKALKEDTLLQSELNDVMVIDKVISNYFKGNKLKSENSKEFLRSVVIDEDLSRFGGPPQTPEEIEFIRKVRKKTEKEGERDKSSTSIIQLPLLYIAVAASISLFLFFTIGLPFRNSLYDKYYSPEKDPVLARYNEHTRGTVQTGIALYFAEKYTESMRYMSPYIHSENNFTYLGLFYALSCMELECNEDLEYIFKKGISESGDDMRVTYTWYYSLYLLRKGEPEKAYHYLSIICQSKNPYDRKAKSLLRKID